MGFKGVFFIPPLTVEARLFFCFLFPFLEISLLDTIIDSSVLRVFFPPSLVSLFTFVFYLLGDFLNFLLIYIYIFFLMFNFSCKFLCLNSLCCLKLFLLKRSPQYSILV